MSVLALIPARRGSKGIPGKNFRPLAGLSPVDLAIRCAEYANIEHVVVSTDAPDRVLPGRASRGTLVILPRPAALAQDDTPMIDVVQHALAAIPGPEDQIILLVQPTQPLRQPKHLQAAVELLRERHNHWEADSVVSVVEVPRIYHPRWHFDVSRDGWLISDDPTRPLPARRQDLPPSYIRDGTVYAFWRRTVSTYGTIYGLRRRALIIDPEETCALDTMADWAEAERRLGAGVPAYDHDDAEADG